MNESRKYVLEFPANYKPKARQHPAYGQWAQMIVRCHNPRSPKYSDYGGRGISVCWRWRKGQAGMSGFLCFMKDMGLRPSPKHSLDRKDNDGNYCKSNCRWATGEEQANNRRSNHLIQVNGESISMMTAARQFGLSYFIVRSRINRGWSVNMALMLPAGFRYFQPKVARGEKLPQTKLTAEKVRLIRQIYGESKPTMLDLAKKFGVSPANVCLIVNRKSWVHLK